MTWNWGGEKAFAIVSWQGLYWRQSEAKYCFYWRAFIWHCDCINMNSILPNLIHHNFRPFPHRLSQNTKEELAWILPNWSRIKGHILAKTEVITLSISFVIHILILTGTTTTIKWTPQLLFCFHCSTFFFFFKEIINTLLVNSVDPFHYRFFLKKQFIIEVILEFSIQQHLIFILATFGCRSHNLDLIEAVIATFSLILKLV